MLHDDAPGTDDAIGSLVAARLPALATEGEVADFFRVHPRTVRRWRDEGRLAFVRTTHAGSGRIRYSQIAVADLLRSLTEHSTPIGRGDDDA